MKTNIFKIVLLVLISSTFFYCADLEEDPIGKLTPESYFKSEGDVEAFILGLYNTPTAGGIYSGNLYLDILSDDYDVDPATVRAYRFAFNEYKFQPSDYRLPVIEYFLPFSQIAHANMLLQSIGQVEMIEEKTNSYKAEAMFVKALNYFYLVRIFGDMPYFETTMDNPSDGSSITRTPAEEIYEHIIEDLKFCINNLPNQYDGDVRNRATKGAALTLLAKIHLTLATYNDIYTDAYDYRTIDQSLIDNLTGDFSSHWEAAADYAMQVINNKGAYGYALVDDFQDLFNGEIGDTEEFIFSVDYYSEAKGGGVSGMYKDGSSFEGWRNNNNALVSARKPIDVGGWSVIVPPLSFYKSFIENDYRRDVSFETQLVETTKPVGGDTTTIISYTSLKDAMLHAPHCAKWIRYPGPCEQWPSGIASSHNVPVFRYAEVLLIAAEALNELGRTEEAITLLNQIRARARLAGGENRSVPVDIPSGLTQQQCWDTIWQERRYELAFEWKRWFDLVRRDSLQNVISRFKTEKLEENPIGSNVQPHHKLLPIPQTEMDNCPNMKQNKGY